MAKKKSKPKIWPHTASELLTICVDWCRELGYFPSDRKWKRYEYVDFEEIVAVLGNGNWSQAKTVIMSAFGEGSGKKKAAKKQKTEAMQMQAAEERELEAEMVEKTEMEAETLEVSEAPQRLEMVEPSETLEALEAVETPEMLEASMVLGPEEVVARNSNRRGRRAYSRAELKEAIVAIQQFWGITGIPTQPQINEAARQIGTPAYTTFSRVFGPKKGWSKIIETNP